VSRLTNAKDRTRYLGIVADGPTDYEIMAKFLKSLLEPAGPCEERMISLNLSVYMSEFRDKASRTQQYGLFDRPAVRLRRAIINVIHSAVGEFKDRISRGLCHSDVLLLNTDAEWPIKAQNEWHEIERIVVFYRIFDGAISEFYNAPGNRRNWEYLPLIVPLVLFPSTDILIAAARCDGDVSFEFRGKKAPWLKQKLYGCSELNRLGPGDLEKKALNHLTREACMRIYSSVPEAQILLRTLTWAHGTRLFRSGNER